MSAFDQTDLLAAAKSLLLTQFKDSPQLAALLGNYVDELQDLEAVLRAIYESKTISGATGAQLDIIGTVVGEPRNERDDDPYRIAINARIAVNLAEGTGDQILDVMHAITGAAGTLTELPPAALLYRVGTTLTPSIAIINGYATALQSITSAGVRTFMQYGIADLATSFTFDGTSSQALDHGTFEDVI